MHVRCPQCRNPIELVDDGSLDQVECPSCGSSFSLIGTDADATYTPESAETLGHFSLDEQLGIGAFGKVWKATDTELDRTVAIKMPRRGQLNAEETEKFLREARAAAQLKHPNIVSVHEVGREGDTVYIVSDLVDGLTMTDWLTGYQPTPREAAEMCRKIAEALHHAHEHGVVHRDLKPGNVMLDRNNEPHIMDFGLAKREAGEITMTMDGQVLGTPAYMSPEQAKGESHEVDRRADIYSLGVILFELITGERPFRGNKQMLLHQLLTEDAPSPRKLNTTIPRDLETICLKCLRKEPEKRYSSAGELANDLDHFLRGEPIAARPVGAVERIWRWCRRNPAVAALLLLVVFVLSAGTAVSTYFAVEASTRAAQEKTERERADREAAQAELAREDATDKLWGSYLAQARAGRWSGRAGRRFDSLEAIEQAAAIRQTVELRDEAIACLTLSDLRSGREWQSRPGDTNEIEFSHDLKFYARSDAQGTIRIRSVGSDELIAKLPGPGRRAWVVHFSPDGEYLGAKHHLNESSYPNQYFVWDLRQKKKVASLPKGISNNAAAFSPDSRRLAAAEFDRLSIYEIPSGKELSSFPLSTKPHSLAWDPGGKRLAISASGRVDLIDASSGKRLASLPHGTSVRGIDWHPHHDLIAAAGGDSNVYLWDLSGSPESEPCAVMRGHEGVVTHVAFNHTGNLLATTSWDGQLILWDPVLEKSLVRVVGFSFEGTLRFSRDDRQLASWRLGKRVGLWEIAAGVELRRLFADSQQNRIWDAQLSSDGRLLGVGRADGLHLWHFPSLRKAAHVDCGVVRCISFREIRGPEGRSSSDFITWGASGLLRWPLQISPSEPDHQRSAQQHVKIGPPLDYGLARPRSPEQAAVSEDQRLIAVADRASGEVIVVDLETEKVLMRAQHDNPSEICLSPDGRFVAGGTWGGTENRVRVWDVTTGKQVKEWQSSSGASVAFDLAGRQLVVGDENEYRFYEAGSWKPLHSIPKEGGARGVVFSPDGNMLALCPNGNSLQLLEPDTYDTIATLDAADGPFSFSRDGSQLIVGGNRRIEIWDLRRIRQQLAGLSLDWNLPPYETIPSEPSEPVQVSVDAGYLATRYLSHQSQPRCVEFSPNGELIASGGSRPDDSIRLWNRKSSELVNVLKYRPWRGVSSLAFAPDGRRWLFSSEFESEAVLWNPDSHTVIRKFPAAGRILKVCFSPDGRTAACAAEKNIHLWDVETGEELGQLKGHTNTVSHVAYSPDGRWIISGSLDGSARLWDPTTGNQIKRLFDEPSHRVYFTAVVNRGKDAIVGFWGGLRQFDVETGDLVHDFGRLYVLSGHSLSEANLVAIGTFNSAGIYNVASGKEIWHMDLERRCRDIAISPDGRSCAAILFGSTKLSVWTLPQ